MAVRFVSVLWHLGIDLVGPGQNSACKVYDSGVAGLFEKLGNALASGARLALHDDFAVAVNLGQAIGHIVLRDQLSADLGDLVFKGFADVEDVSIFAGVDSAL